MRDKSPKASLNVGDPVELHVAAPGRQASPPNTPHPPANLALSSVLGEGVDQKG